MSKCKVIIITNSELVSGFGLAGVEVQEARNGEEATAIVSRIISVGREFGIIGIDEDLHAKVDPKLIEDIEEAGVPLLITFPTAGIYSQDKLKQEDDYTANLIRNAIGYHIKLNR